ncbi:shikimate dehydrogenase [Candidatus Poriferisodalis sp.]|uniref:shikimate dehydrogenase n=1 Tax=Candidatus Poriferisodalis sp. TaxID=3101277 RepID=UPI003B01C74A
MRPALSGDTKVAGVIGDPVRHSLSPALHNAGFAHLGLDWAYVAFEVPAGGGAGAVAAMRALGIDGLSVTMPLKAEVVEACDELSPAAAMLGAVNCVRRSGDRMIGENTDGVGFVNSLRRQAGVEFAGMHAVVLGGGGAARAVVAALVSEGASVTIVNRSMESAVRAAELGKAAAAAAGVGSSMSVMVGAPGAVRDADLVVNATPLGMNAADPMPVAPEMLRRGQMAVDLIYMPAVTPFLEVADEAGAQILNGTGMLLFQAAEQFKMWTGRDAPVKAMGAAVGLDIAG